MTLTPRALAPYNASRNFRGGRVAQEPSRPFTVSEYQDMLSGIYTRANERYSDENLFRRLIEEMSVVMELVRKDRREKLPEQLARTYSWLNALANRHKVDLQEVLWWKYPNVCTYCLRPKDCYCTVEHPDIPDKEGVLRRLRRDRSQEPRLLKDHQELHRRLYGRQNDRILVIQIAAHLIEEAGEMSCDLRHGNIQEFESEMVDVISWIFAIANRLNIDLAEKVWEQYPGECERCHETVCVLCKSSNPPEKTSKGVARIMASEVKQL